MNRGIYAAATGMETSQAWLDVVTNNLANVSTNGFKRDDLLFNDALQKELASNGGMGAPLGSIGSGATVAQEYTSFDQGPIRITGNATDFAISGVSASSPNTAAAFAVQTPEGVRYTRDGSFLVNDGALTTRDGYAVLDDSGSRITVPTGNLTTHGTQIMVNGKGVATLGVYAGSFAKLGGNLFSSSNAQAVSDVPVQSSALEGSNVNAIGSMVDMIKIGRSYDLAQKSITSQDELTQKLVQSLSS